MFPAPRPCCWSSGTSQGLEPLWSFTTSALDTELGVCLAMS